MRSGTRVSGPAETRPLRCSIRRCRRIAVRSRSTPKRISPKNGPWRKTISGWRFGKRGRGPAETRPLRSARSGGAGLSECAADFYQSRSAPGLGHDARQSRGCALGRGETGRWRQGRCVVQSGGAGVSQCARGAHQSRSAAGLGRDARSISAMRSGTRASGPAETRPQRCSTRQCRRIAVRSRSTRKPICPKSGPQRKAISGLRSWTRESGPPETRLLR